MDMTSKILLLLPILACGCRDSASTVPVQAMSTVREEKHFYAPYGEQTWVYTIDIDGHRLAVASCSRGVSICEVTDRSLIPTPAHTQAEDPMFDPNGPIRNTWHGWGIIQVTPGFMAQDWFSTSNLWAKWGIESRIVQTSTNGLTVIAYRRINAESPK